MEIDQHEQQQQIDRHSNGDPGECTGTCVMPADEVVRNVSFVCRSWGKALSLSCCWSDVDLDQWSCRVKHTDKIDEVVMKLLTRSKGILQSLSGYKLGKPDFSFAWSRPVLRIVMSKVSDAMVNQHVLSLSVLEELDISDCINISSIGIHLLGRRYKNLVKLKRNMPPPEFMIMKGLRKESYDEEEVVYVAFSMSRLEHLELTFGLFDDDGLSAILGHCKHLRVLDIRGCSNVRLGKDLLYRFRRIEEFKDPWEVQEPWEGENDIFF